MSPRRSSRARTTQPPSNAQTAHSVSSSVSSARTDRATRTDYKQASPHKSSTPHSLSSEESEEPSHDLQMDRPLTRRRTREQDIDEDDLAKLDDDLDDEMVEEDEVTRCVCGYQEYPGPPSDAAKSLEGDDLSGLFIQCDICKVWQHGGCVGIMDEAASPEEYFCEECRKDLHKVTTSPKGQKYSRYLPVYDQQHGKKARKSSVSKETVSPPSRHNDRNARASVDSLGKRRSTMNSRAAYDEDEVLRKVLEESKHEGAPPSENGTRKKRSRDDSEETKPEVKRQRTGSRSPSNSPVLESEDDSTKASAPKQKPRGAAARSQREKEQREKEREQERTEAANRRKGRAERRKADGTSETVVQMCGRPPQKSRGRLGRNQYSRDTLSAANGASLANDVVNSPQPSGTNGNSNGHESSDGATGHKTTKSKNSRLHKLSWNDIMRPAGAMQSYIAQRQVEMAGEKASPAPAVQPPTNGEQYQAESKHEDTELSVFKDLSTTQMMDHLSRDLVHWQKMIIEQKEK
ncbi:hypothetical protein BU25DRAFT_332235 [Macroventuria anomochaeta]|uniref:Uncharacterized protein n=1 Tax=Macroventuria anomochaeta TaxID=301207 RepID=A0ACB6SBY2_9PLEO|nr:uncharacterized protein BU25DRAFT_332235 [Macroventuria anomochaeta]KAF2631518.1 hypothetical protein BU25DRAFT_332235 [Macroventuria anomochaeta]